MLPIVLYGLATVALALLLSAMLVVPAVLLVERVVHTIRKRRR